MKNKKEKQDKNNKVDSTSSETTQPVEEITLPIEEKSLEMLKTVEEVQSNMEEFYPELLKEDLSDKAIQTAESLKRTTTNISKAAKITNIMQDELRGRVRDIQKNRKRNKILASPPNSKIDIQETEMNSFAKGLNVYKILLICFIGSFFGVIIESIWFFIRHGYLQSRAGLIYGPFNLLYGFGAVVLSLTLYKFRNRGVWLSFIGGMIVGSLVEYGCSWFQEFFFGSRSWDYSNVPFNINGRICLLYSVFWGILGVLWIKDLYPRMANLILKIPNKIGKILTWVLLAFFIINATMSCISVGRWSARNRGIPPSNTFWQSIDKHFPDERMEHVYASMVFDDKNSVDSTSEVQTDE